MRVVITDSGVDELRLASHAALPSSKGLWQRLVRFNARDFVSKTKLAGFLAGNKSHDHATGCQRRFWSSLMEYSKAYRRDSFFFMDGYGHIPQRALKRHSAFLVYQRRYYQSMQQASKQCDPKHWKEGAGLGQ